MARKKVKLARILNESARKASLQKRRAGLFKKAEELCVLCDVQTGIVIYSPDQEAPAVWPSQGEMQGLMAKFLAMPETERARKSNTLESYLKDRMEKEEEKINKAKKKNDEKEMKQIMCQLVEPNMDVNHALVDVSQLNALSMLVADVLENLHKRNQQIMISLQNHPSAPPPPPPPPPPPQVASAPVDELAAPLDGDRDVIRTLNIPTSIEQLMNDQWFMDTMTDHQDLHIHIGGPSSSTTAGNDLGLPPEYAAGTSGTKDKELPDDPNSAWPHIYSP